MKRDELAEDLERHGYKDLAKRVIEEDFDMPKTELAQELQQRRGGSEVLDKLTAGEYSGE